METRFFTPMLAFGIILLPFSPMPKAEDQSTVFRIEMHLQDKNVQDLLRELCGIGGVQIKVDGQSIPLVPTVPPDFDRTLLSSKMKFNNATTPESTASHQRRASRCFGPVWSYA
jgi:Fe-S cluster assembly iron-binding protein IscA